MDAEKNPVLLRETYRREGLSLLQYVRQAEPFARRVDRPLAEKVRTMAEEEGRFLEALAGEIADAKLVVPSLGGFPSEYANYNFFDVRKLVPLLIVDQERLISVLSAETSEEDASSEELTSRLLREKQRHLEELKALAV